MGKCGGMKQASHKHQRDRSIIAVHKAGRPNAHGGAFASYGHCTQQPARLSPPTPETLPRLWKRACKKAWGSPCLPFTSCSDPHAPPLGGGLAFISCWASGPSPGWTGGGLGGGGKALVAWVSGPGQGQGENTPGQRTQGPPRGLEEEPVWVSSSPNSKRGCNLQDLCGPTAKPQPPIREKNQGAGPGPGVAAQKATHALHCKAYSKEKGYLGRCPGWTATHSYAGQSKERRAKRC